MKRCALLLAVAAALSGCGGSGDDVAEDPDSPLVRAAQRSANETSVRARMSMSASGREDYAMDGISTMTADASRVWMKADFTQDGETLPMEIVMRRDVAWIRSPSFKGVLPPGKTWMRIVDETTAPTTMTFQDFLEMIRATGEVEQLGAERIAGRATTHYRAPITMDEVLERSPPETAKRLAFLRRFDEEIPVDVWIDEGGLLRRMKLKVTIGGESAMLDATILDYGVPVKADPPPASAVVDESELGG